jgi:hypothetical protein
MARVGRPRVGHRGCLWLTIFLCHPTALALVVRHRSPGLDRLHAHAVPAGNDQGVAAGQQMFVPWAPPSEVARRGFQ